MAQIPDNSTRNADEDSGRDNTHSGNTGLTGTQPSRPSERSDHEKASFLQRHPIGVSASIIGFVAVVVAGYFVWLTSFHPFESTDDAFVEARNFPVAVRVAGYLETVDVTDNQHVQPGAIIARIRPRDYQIALDQANGMVEAAKASIVSANAQIGVAEANINEMQAQQASAQAALQFSSDEANRQSDLVQSGAGTVQTLQQAQANLRQAQAAFNQAAASVTSAMKNKVAAQAQQTSALASLKQAEAQRESAQQNLIYTEIKAEQPGRVVQLSGAKGQFVETGQAIAMFVPDDMWVTANFKETQLDRMRPGQPVEMTIDAYPDHTLRGKIASVQPGSGTAFSLLPAENATGNYVKVTQRVPVKISVDQWPADVAIGPGMSVVPTVTVQPES